MVLRCEAQPEFLELCYRSLDEPEKLPPQCCVALNDELPKFDKEPEECKSLAQDTLTSDVERAHAIFRHLSVVALGRLSMCSKLLCDAVANRLRFIAQQHNIEQQCIASPLSMSRALHLGLVSCSPRHVVEGVIIPDLLRLNPHLDLDQLNTYLIKEFDPGYMHWSDFRPCTPRWVYRSGGHQGLDSVHLQHLGIKQLPESFGTLVMHGRLNLSGNDLTHLPAHFGHLTVKGDLSLDRNRLQSLPRTIEALTVGGTLSLQHNPQCLCQEASCRVLSRVFGPTLVPTAEPSPRGRHTGRQINHGE